MAKEAIESLFILIFSVRCQIRLSLVSGFSKGSVRKYNIMPIHFDFRLELVGKSSQVEWFYAPRRFPSS